MTQVTRWRSSSWWALVILFSSLLAAPQIRAQQRIDWPEATAELNNLRPKAITCVGLIKQYGTRNELAGAALDYADGQSEVESIISGLTVALTPGGAAAGLPSLQTHLSAAAVKLQGLCAVARQRIPQDPGSKGIIDEIAKTAIDALVNTVSNGIAALYTDHRSDADLTRKTIITQLEGARWPDFNLISSGP